MIFLKTALKPVDPNNFLDKYADDTYLIVSSSNEHSLHAELKSIESWAVKNNLKLNRKKSSEMIIFSNVKASRPPPHIDLIPDIERVESIKILGVLMNGNFSMNDHVSALCQSAAQSLYAIKLLKSHGLDARCCQMVFKAIVISKLTYAAAAWWGFVNTSEKQRLQSVLNRSVKWGYYSTNDPAIEELVDSRANKLFYSILNNPCHVLHHLLPPNNTHTHNLRPRAHNRQLPKKSTTVLSKTFIYRLLYSTIIP